MRILSAKKISTIKYALAKMAYGITGYKINIKEIKNSDDIAYTEKRNNIFINFKHKYLEGFKENQAIMMIYGLFAHEIMHKLLSDFNALSDAISRHKACGYAEADIFQCINNILEDSFIENYADRYLGDDLLRDLSFMRARCYEMSDPIDQKESGLEQFISASIQFGDAGLVKGHFTDETAKQCFVDALPIMDAGLKEPNVNKRISYSDKIVDIIRPLWENEEQKNLDEMMSRLEEMMKDRMPGTPSGGGEGGSPIAVIEIEMDDESESESGESSSESGDGSSSEASGDIKSDASESDGSAEKSKDEKEGEKSDSPDKSKKKPIDSRRAYTMSRFKANSEETSSDSESDNGDSSPEEESAPKESVPQKSAESDNEEGFTDSEEGFTDNIVEELEFTEEDEKRIESEMEAAEKAIASEEKKEAEYSDVEINLDVSNGYRDLCKDKRCKNIRVKSPRNESNEKIYALTVSQISMGINHLSNQLKRIFKNDQEEKSYKTSGKIDIKRASGGRMTTRVFTKRTAPSAKSDVAICILIDESGSMWHSSKITHARTCAIGLAEVFAKLKIPISVIGFSADEYFGVSYDAVHRHYLNWKNTHNERLKLLEIKARDNNFDGYSIRYAAKYLGNINAEHKMLIVISDGVPAANAYYSNSCGIMDTKMAIKEASKEAVVIGVLLGQENPEVHREMYGYNFVHINSPQDLFQQLGKTIAKQIKGW